MATSAIGRLTEFNPKDQSVDSYLEMVESFFKVNNIAQESKVAVFLTAVGNKTYEILHTHSAPEQPEQKSYEEIVTLFKQHCSRSGSTFKRLVSRLQMKENTPAQDPEGQTDASKSSTDSAQSPTSGEMVNNTGKNLHNTTVVESL